MNDPEVVRRDEGLGDLTRDRKRVRKAEPLAFPRDPVRARLAGASSARVLPPTSSMTMARTGPDSSMP